MRLMEMKIFQTAKNTGDRLADKGNLAASNEADLQHTVLKLDPEKKYQSFMGFGGAFTEAAAYTLAQIPAEDRLKVIESYFNQETGLGYSLGRTHIHSCDFALENYTYVEENDVELKTFSIEREHKYVLPLIKDAVKAREKSLRCCLPPGALQLG